MSKVFTFDRTLCVFFSVLALLHASIGMIGLWFQCHSHILMIPHQLWPFWANLDRCWTSSTSIEMIGLWFQCHSHTLMIRQQLWPFWANLDRRWMSSTSPERCSCDVVFTQHWAILEQSSCRTFRAYNMRKNCLRYANIISNLSNSDSRIIKSFSSLLHCFHRLLTCSGDQDEPRHLHLFGLPLNHWYHNWTCVLLILDSPNVTVNISNILAYLLLFFIWNLIQKSTLKTRPTFLSVKNKVTIQNGWYWQHI